MHEKVRTALILISAFTIGFFAFQVYKDQAKIQGLERRIAAEQAHSATCDWGCPSTLRDHDAEYERRIAALQAREDAVYAEWLNTDPAEVCSLALVRNAVREFPRRGPRVLDPDTITARVYELAKEACIEHRYMHEAHPNHVGYRSWVENCAAAGYRSALPGVPSNMLTPNDPDPEIR